MYKLTKKIQKMLTENVTIRTKVALGMGVGENAVMMSLRRTKGESIANSVGGVKTLIQETGLSESEIIELQKTAIKC